MTLNTDKLIEALQENIKLRRELATEVAEAKGENLPAVRYRLARILGTFRYALFWRLRRASVSATVVELMTLDGARKQYVAQLRQLDRQALLKEFEQLRQLLVDLTPPFLKSCEGVFRQAPYRRVPKGPRPTRTFGNRT